MVTKTNMTVEFKGTSGRMYTFELYKFDNYDDIKGVYKKIPALYAFGKLSDDQRSFEHIYLGKTDDLSTRFDNHHKEPCIKRNGANCIGLCILSEFYTESRLAFAENDILLNNNFTCNEQNN